MKRREFIKLLGGAAAWPLAARAQQAAIPIIGFLNNTTPETYEPFVASFRRGLGQVGYIERQNVTIEYRWGRNEGNRLPDLAKQLVQRDVTVIVASGGDQAVRAAQAATRTIPIVATIGSDPVETGFVHSLNRPDGNITGVSVFAVQLVAKTAGVGARVYPAGGSHRFLGESEQCKLPNLHT